MSDVPATAWWTLALLLASKHATGSSFLAGVATGIAVLTRPNLAPLSLAVVVTMLWRRPREPQPGAPPGRLLLAYLAGGVPAAIGLALLQTVCRLTTGSVGAINEYSARSTLFQHAVRGALSWRTAALP